MEKTNFWNDAAKAGAVLGVLLAVSFIVENQITLAGRVGLYMLYLVEWIAVVIAHYYLLHRFARSRSALCTAEEGFSFMQGYTSVLAVSGLAGIIVGAVQALYLHVAVGYSAYVDRLIAAVERIVAGSGGIPASMEGLFAQSMEQLQTAPVPSVLQTLWGGIFSSLLFGAVFGLIIAGVLSRAPRPFGEPGNE